MEIERKFIVPRLPADLDGCPFLQIEQAYLNVDPVIRVRRENDQYYMTYKGSGILAHEEYNLALNESAYRHLLDKADGNIISKRRYLIPLERPNFKKGVPIPEEDRSLTIELDIFDPPFAPRFVAEVEFSSTESAEAFLPPAWFDREVTYCEEYRNSYMAMQKL